MNKANQTTIPFGLKLKTYIFSFDSNILLTCVFVLIVLTLAELAQEIPIVRNSYSWYQFLNTIIRICQVACIAIVGCSMISIPKNIKIAKEFNSICDNGFSENELANFSKRLESCNYGRYNWAFKYLRILQQLYEEECVTSRERLKSDKNPKNQMNFIHLKRCRDKIREINKRYNQTVINEIR